MKTTTELKLKNRMMVLAGITLDDTLAVLEIPNVNKNIQLKYVPNWFDKLRYKICGFDLTVIRTRPAVKNQKVTDHVKKIVQYYDEV